MYWFTCMLLVFISTLYLVKFDKVQLTLVSRRNDVHILAIIFEKVTFWNEPLNLRQNLTWKQLENKSSSLQLWCSNIFEEILQAEFQINMSILSSNEMSAPGSNRSMKDREKFIWKPAFIENHINVGNQQWTCTSWFYPKINRCRPWKWTR